MITDEDVEKLKTTFATKSDLGGFATKKDLESFTTKSDVQELKSEFKEFREEFGVVKENIQAILTILDKQNKPIAEIKQENAMSTGRLNRHEDWIKHIAKETNTTLITE
jgi:hypothetical protein